jgi:squalene-hopene/tetraprenyl-beta-curcumene cyclase
MTLEQTASLGNETGTGTDTGVALRAALDRAVRHLRDLQHTGGWWQGELETNVTMDAEDLLMREFLGVRTAEQTQESARWIRSQQRDDGSWANFHGGPSDLSTTVEAYLALRLAGDGPDVPHLVRARGCILAGGGLEASRVFTRMWLALFGLWDWARLPAVPVEHILLPRWVPLDVYDFACWARQTIVPISVLSSLRPRRELGVRLDELYAGRSPGAREVAPRSGWDLAFGLLDRTLHVVERCGGTPWRARALRRAERWVVERQEADGSWGGIQPPWVYSLMALHALGRPVEDPVLALGLAGWERFTVHEQTPDGPVRRIEACQSPVWDTALALVALGDCGVTAADPAVAAAVDWLLGEEVRVRGDWAVERPGVAPGGWAFEFDNDGYPDVDDTAEVVLALLRVDAGARAGGAVDRALAWVRAMQCRDGGWAAFDADNTREVAYRLPFCDFGAVIDPPSADVTAHVLEMLGRRGLAGTREARRGLQWLLGQQEPDGSWFGRWGANHVYGTGAAVPALVAVGVPASAPVVQRAVRWLRAHQNADGGWGEDLRSYTDPGWRGRGESTASQTAWALLALHAAGEAGGAAAQRGVRWLVDTQRPDGTWDEPQFTGTGFPGDFYINYHLYRLVFPTSALARCLGGAP